MVHGGSFRIRCKSRLRNSEFEIGFTMTTTLASWRFTCFLVVIRLVISRKQVNIIKKLKKCKRFHEKWHIRVNN